LHGCPPHAYSRM